MRSLRRNKGNIMTAKTGRDTGQSWPQLAVDAWILGAEMSCVIWLRTMRVAMGGKAAERELEHMVREKAAAHLAFGAKVVSGKAGATPQTIAGAALSHYGKDVRANRRRLTGG
jgi:hypothetical protein